MYADQNNVGRGFWSERYIVGSLLILGLLLLIPGVQLFIVAQNYLAIPDWARSIDRYAWERNLVSACVAVTLLGLVILEDMLRQAGDHILSRLGLVSFTLGTVMWLTVNALNLDGRGWIVAAAILWSFGMLIFVLPGNRGPLFYEPALFLIAIALLLKRVQVPVAGTIAQIARYKITENNHLAACNNVLRRISLLVQCAEGAPAKGD